MGDELRRARRDHIDCKAKASGMKEEFVHDHVNHHDNGEQDREDNGHESCSLWASLEGQNSVQKWCCQKMHRQLIR